MMDTKRPLRVFLCHASGDKPAVTKLYERLIKDGVDAWLDKEKLIPGQDWQIEIPKAVKNSDAVIVCLSSQSVTKEGYVQKEIKIALDAADEKPAGTIFIIPARLENCEVPERIGRFHWVDLFSDDGYEWLLKALQIRANNLGIIKGSEETKEERLLSIDTRPLLGTNGQVSNVSFDEFATIGDLLDSIWFAMENYVPAFSYQKKWLLRDAVNRHVFLDIGAKLDEGKYISDNRTLQQIGILPGMKLEVIHRFNLTERQREVLRHMAQGVSNQEIEQLLDIPPAALAKHLDRIYKKL